MRRGLTHRNQVDEQTELDIIAPELKELFLRLMKLLAHLHRLIREDKPVGVLPSPITARPKGRGLMPRHEWMLDG
jgi:hypothetical protein